jgi:hypothetical protein
VTGKARPGEVRVALTQAQAGQVMLYLRRRSTESARTLLVDDLPSEIKQESASLARHLRLWRAVTARNRAHIRLSRDDAARFVRALDGAIFSFSLEAAEFGFRCREQLRGQGRRSELTREKLQANIAAAAHPNEWKRTKVDAKTLDGWKRRLRELDESLLTAAPRKRGRPSKGVRI